MKLLALLLTGCVSLPNLAPTPRDIPEQMKSLVYLESACGDQYESYHSHKFGMGVAVNDRYVVTAAHVVGCAEIPYVAAQVSTGVTRLVVTKDDILFGTGKDIALLEERSAQNFGIGLGPVVLAPTHEGQVSVYTRNKVQDGFIVGNYLSVNIEPGDSGSPVWTPAGELVGIVTHELRNASNEQIGTQVQRMDLGWRF